MQFLVSFSIPSFRIPSKFIHLVLAFFALYLLSSVCKLVKYQQGNKKLFVEHSTSTIFWWLSLSHRARVRALQNEKVEIEKTKLSIFSTNWNIWWCSLFFGIQSCANRNGVTTNHKHKFVYDAFYAYKSTLWTQIHSIIFYFHSLHS